MPNPLADVLSNSRRLIVADIRPGQRTTPQCRAMGGLQSARTIDETLIVWAGEFGRTPHASQRDGRDHHPEGFSVWLAGGGVKGGTIYGATDEMGMFATQDPVTMHDLHATILHLLGLDHEKVTFRFGGRHMRLTDVHGRVVKDILA